MSEMQQRTPEWLDARLGRLTASVAHVPYMKGRGNAESVTRRDLRYRLACERITGQPSEDVLDNANIRRGVELEPAARATYESATGRLVQEVGFIPHAELMAGCSPDGLIDEDGGLELKCPKPAIHVGYCEAGVVPEDYRYQLIHSLWVTGRSYWDFGSYCPVLGKGRLLLVIRYERNDDEIAAHDTVVRQFLRDVADTQERVLALKVTA